MLRTGFFLVRCFGLWLLFLFAVSCRNRDSKSNVSRAGYASLDTGVTYVGMNTCRQCHAGIYDTYIRTGMGRSFAPASRLKSSADFGPGSVVRDDYRNLNYHPYWQGEDFLVDEFRMSAGDTVYKRTEQVNFIVGSGQHTNSHLRSVNGYMYQLPLTFYTQQRTWDLPPGFEHGNNSRFSRRIELECISCHNGYPRLVAGSENKYADVPSGIDCERCHGPGSRHVALKQQGEMVDTSAAVDYSIVNPAKLPVELQLDICQRCHIQGNAVLAKDKSFFDFRPGMNLSDVMDVYMPVYKGQEEEHIMASHAERMKLSACFVRSKAVAEKAGQGAKALRPYRNAMTCVTCHNPHVSVKETGRETFNDACNRCHTGRPAAGGVASSTLVCDGDLQLRKKSGDDCVGCHMPKNNTIDIPHVTVTDHFIRRPVTPNYKREVRQFVTLACINRPDADRRSRGIAYLNHYEKFVHDRTFLDSARRYLEPADDVEFVDRYDALVRLGFLSEDYTEVIRLSSKFAGLKTAASAADGPERSWTFYRIAESYQKTGAVDAAISYYREAVRLLPFQAAFRNKYASALESVGRPNEAVEQYRFLLKEVPDDVTALVNYGYLLLTSRQDLAAADSLYERALALDPDHVQALINKTGTCVLKGDRSAARRYLERAARLDPNNARIRAMKEALIP
jgi:predicted CXXCH cytochrome family protein